MKLNFILLTSAVISLSSCGGNDNKATEPEENQETAELVVNKTPKIEMTSFYNFKMRTLDGEDFDFSSLKGKKVLIVNTASECGYTPQYAQLQELYDTEGGKEFEILGFPANNFGAQEPGSNEEIAHFCSKNYGVSFTMFEKISVKGDDTHPIYEWLTQKELNGVSNAEVKWNFFKFLIDENGNWVKVLPSSVSPVDEQIISWIKS